MPIVEKIQPRSNPIGLASCDGFSWARLVTGIFAVAISLATSWRTGLMPIEQPRMKAPLTALEQPAAPEQPATERLADRREPEVAEVAAPPEMLPQPVALAQAPPRPAARPHASPKRHPHQHMTAQASAKVPSATIRSGAFSQGTKDADPWSIQYDPIAHTKLTRSRSEVRNEYLATREQVAALTGEDSGSAYLARQAARQNAARANLRAHAAGASDAGRRPRTT